MSLRARTRALIKEEVRTSAMSLFLANGFESTTISQIAQDAGISQSSFFRYFPTKEDVVFDEPHEPAHALEEQLKARPTDEGVWSSLVETLRLRTGTWRRNPQAAAQILRLVSSSDSLRARQLEEVNRWQHALVTEVARRLGDEDKLATVRASALVASVFGCLDAAYQAWPEFPDSSLDELFDAATRAVRPEPDAQRERGS